MHCIENKFLKIRAREFGAELISIYSKQTSIEHLWNADEKFWGWYAPVLFPVVGRCRNDEIILDRKKFRMEKHGFARKSNFELLELGETKMIFRLKDSEETFKIYPYHFEFLICYRLYENKLTCAYEVLNRDGKEIYFQLGGHPAFSVPFFIHENYEDYYLQFEHEENSLRHLINTEGFFDDRKENVFNHSDKIHLHKNLFADDALIFKDLKSRKVSLRTNNHAHSLSVSFHDFNYLGVWAKVGAPYVCIEPWRGCADTDGKEKEFKEKEGVIALPAGDEFKISFEIEVN